MLNRALIPALLAALAFSAAPLRAETTLDLLFRNQAKPAAAPAVLPAAAPEPALVGEPLLTSRIAEDEAAPAEPKLKVKRIGKSKRMVDEQGRITSSGGARPEIVPREPKTVALNTTEEAGTVIINSSGRELFYVLGGGQAYRYRIAVGKEGFSWAGTEEVSNITNWPEWFPPEEMRLRKPELPERMTGGVNNPLGAKAIYLGKTLYRIHGTNEPKSIGRAASSGCFRMNNADVVHLASLITVGTKVKVIDSFKNQKPGPPPPHPSRRRR